MKKRIAYVIGDYPPEERLRREKVALSYSSAEVEVGIVSMPVSPYLFGITPAEVSLVAPSMMAAFKEAEKQGYDAVVPLGMLDLGVEGGRSIVDIPVLAPFESCLYLAQILGDRIGVIAYHEMHFPNMEHLIHRYGMKKKVVGVAASGFDIPNIAANKDAMIENFVQVARKLISKKRAQVIIPFGITQCPVHIDPRWLSKELGVPVVEGIGAPIRLAAMFSHLGLAHSRKRWPKSASLDG